MKRSITLAAVAAAASMMNGCVTVKNYYPRASAEAPNIPPPPPPPFVSYGPVSPPEERIVKIEFRGPVEVSPGQIPGQIRLAFRPASQDAVDRFTAARMNEYPASVTLAFKRQGAEGPCIGLEPDGLALPGRRSDGRLVIGHMKASTADADRAASCLTIKVGRLVKLASPAPAQ